MFSYSYNYLLFFFNYELIIPTCFFFFLFFVLIFDQGQIGASLHEMSLESKNKLLKYLEIRNSMILELSSFLSNTISQMKRISYSFENSSLDLLYSIQFIFKKIALNNIILHVKYFHEILIYRTLLLTFDIKSYFTNDLFSEKSYVLDNSSKKFKVIDF